MSTHGDSQRSIAAWLEAEAPDQAPTRLIEASRARIRTTPQRTAWWPARKGSNRNAFAKIAIAAAVVVGAFGVVGLTQLNGPTTGPAGPSPSPAIASPTPQSSVAVPSSSVDGPTSEGDGVLEGQWPQTTDEDVRHAQERADAGDPAYTWQVDRALAERGVAPQDGRFTTPEIVDRFLREVLGWDAYLFTEREWGKWPADRSNAGLTYIRCARGGSNPLYPNADERSPDAEGCAPTIDGVSHESVHLDLAQPGLSDQDGVQDPDAIWVVGEWAMTAPVTEVDPRVAETGATAQLEEWLAARIAGKGAEGKIDVEDDRGDGRCASTLRDPVARRFVEAAVCRIEDVPLLYATTSGAPYERYEIQRTDGPHWPYAEMEFKVRLFARDGATVVEQPILWIEKRQPFDGRGERLGFVSNVRNVTENGQPVAASYRFLDDAVRASAARPWKVSHQASNYGLSLDGDYGAERVTFVPDPYLVIGRSETGPAPVDAAGLARRIRSDPTFEATAPVDLTIGGAAALSMDVKLAPGASVWRGEDGRSPLLQASVPYPYAEPMWPAPSWGALIDPDSRMRLYLVDLPEGSANRMLAIAIGAPAQRFEEVLDAAAPIVDSIEFHAP